MYYSPDSLQSLCVDAICDNIEDVFDDYRVQILSEHTAGTEKGTGSVHTQTEVEVFDIPPYLPKSTYHTKYRFRQKDLFLPAELAQFLFEQLGKRGFLTDETISLFSVENTRLVHVKIKDARDLSLRGLRQLYNHKIVNLECVNMRIPINDLIRCLGDWTIRNLKYLNISHSEFTDMSKYCLSKFKSLQTLNVSHTKFNRLALEFVCEDLKQLESLNISYTSVDDITSLKSCKDRLTSLAMFNLADGFSGSLIPIILELHCLTYLDISSEKPGMYPYEIIAPRCNLADLLKNVDALPNLTYLDLSGKQEIESKVLVDFVTSHRKLTFLGLMFCDCCAEEMFTNPKHVSYRENLTVSGMANLQQILVSLKMYSGRAMYVQKSLYYLFRLSPTLNEPRSDIIELVLPGMENHPQEFVVQMAATACLYNLTKGELAMSIHPNLLKRVVHLTLDAMKNFPNHNQIQKNALLTLCSDRILQDVNFNKFRCAQLVILALCGTEDASMNRMAVAIISILAAKITTTETSLIGSVPMYMKKLLSMIRAKVQDKVCDITLKFTLSALWNLTDESSMTCKVFLREGGIELFLKVLKTFEGESSIETKVLGLINNIAEVANLRKKLFISEFILKLKELLNSEHIDVSYFAAGIIAHLASDGESSWTVEEVSRSEMLCCLGEVVSNWKTPDGEMVAYRSFGPFFPLLLCTIDYQIQLWAVWAIHHVCSKNPKRYCRMLVEECGHRHLEAIVDDPRSNENIKKIASAILESLKSETGAA